MIEKIVNIIFSEYGAFVAFLVLSNAMMGYAIKKLWEQNKELSDKFIVYVQDSVKVLTRIEEKLDSVDSNH